MHYGGGNLQPQIMEYKIIQKYGDRGTDNYSVSDISHTIPSNPMSDREQLLLENNMEEKVFNYRIRKLTPREAFRLMDVDEENIDKIQESGISKTQQYHLAGNSIVVACMVGIFENLFINDLVQDSLF